MCELMIDTQEEAFLPRFDLLMCTHKECSFYSLFVIEITH